MDPEIPASSIVLSWTWGIFLGALLEIKSNVKKKNECQRNSSIFRVRQDLPQWNITGFHGAGPGGIKQLKFHRASIAWGKDFVWFSAFPASGLGSAPEGGLTDRREERQKSLSLFEGSGYS